MAWTAQPYRGQQSGLASTIFNPILRAKGIRGYALSIPRRFRPPVGCIALLKDFNDGAAASHLRNRLHDHSGIEPDHTFRASADSDREDGAGILKAATNDIQNQRHGLAPANTLCFTNDIAESPDVASGLAQCLPNHVTCRSEPVRPHQAVCTISTPKDPSRPARADLSQSPSHRPLRRHSATDQSKRERAISARSLRDTSLTVTFHAVTGSPVYCGSAC